MMRARRMSRERERKKAPCSRSCRISIDDCGCVFKCFFFSPVSSLFTSTSCSLLLFRAAFNGAALFCWAARACRFPAEPIAGRSARLIESLGAAAMCFFLSFAFPFRAENIEYLFCLTVNGTTRVTHRVRVALGTAPRDAMRPPIFVQLSLRTIRFLRFS